MATTKMTYRFLGNSGLLVSKLSLGAWMFFDKSDPRYTADNWYKMMLTAFKNGINFFDNAENYTDGYSEELTGLAIKRGIQEGVWNRDDLVVTTKFFAGTKGFTGAGPNDQGVSRKHISEGIKASLRRLELDNVDVVFCHRSEPYTPIKETVRAMNFVIQQGWAYYWGTSEWLASDIQEACETADRLGLIRPVVEQSQYSMFDRNKVEFEFVDLYKNAGRPSDSRFATPMFKDMQLVPSFDKRVEMSDKIKLIAAELGCSLPQLALACRPEQLEENLKALAFVDKVTPEVKAKVDAIVNFVPTVPELNSLATLRGRHL
ncbi:voltage-gated potassium channel subunit beta, putative [Phytophthora infestans T30-4]|uniref:Voltage-gated potassium channel subunit beta, putative n=1 Tax=Phytophthora infestans (strain T30-4) TaxID=403677 RepID=D0NI89_PHYIT|nr:voltage-gated potassium channel subunit beta, putative [Phytophthora infestans T30-4]EEY59174.1 voltage-gated potassium channel subunit beta, putative [Phytophthora infestans T30-4]|eukprot:XP_002901188.1 voltage-gated potassium channel subunit beta, putative [Phytophthora infestans T30-4]